MQEREGVLKTELESIKEEKERIENELKAELKESEMEVMLEFMQCILNNLYMYMCIKWPITTCKVLFLHVLSG